MRTTLQKFFTLFLLLSCLITVSSAQAQVPWLHVEGNQIKDEAGNPVTLRGVSVLPAEHNNECTTCNSKPISEMITWQADASQGWHSRVVRLQITTAKVKDPATSFKTMIDPYVQQAIAKGLYVIIDLHLVANYDYNGSGGVAQSKVMDFWNYVAPRYANTPNVIFELFNEPISPDCWSCWKEYIQPVVNSVRSAAPNNLILMGGPQWSTRVNQAVSDPIAGNNIVYVYHIYPNQGQASETNLSTKFGDAAQKIPVIISEFGWNQDDNYTDGITRGTTSNWGVPFRQYVDARPNISWISYIFDNFWKPQYFDWNWNLMSGENQGQFMQQWFRETKDHNQPEPDNLTAAAVTSNQINLSWPATAGTSSYTVKRAATSNGPYTTIADGVTARNFTDIGLNAQTTYYYVVSPVTSGVEGPHSTEASATTEAAGTTPDVPMAVKATGGNGQVSLKWRQAPGALSYNVKRSLVSGGPYRIIASGVTTADYTDTGVGNGKIYYYVVSSVGDKESANSSEADGIPSSQMIIVDNPDAELTGSWTTSSYSRIRIGSNYLHDGTTGSTGGKSARYPLNLPDAGKYHVSLFWSESSNRATNVPIDVNHSGGTTTFKVNQQTNGGEWVALGTFEFNADTTYNVTIRNDDANGMVIADAVKLVLISDVESNTSPIASIEYTTTNLKVDFDASGSWDADGAVTSYAWDFGDGTSGDGLAVSHTYTAAGDYMVSLTVMDDSSATNTVQQLVTVKEPMYVKDITKGFALANKKGYKHGIATVLIHDRLGNPVGNANVLVRLSGDFNEIQDGVTGADGLFSLISSGTKRGKLNFEVCVEEVTHASLHYDSLQNTITCTGSAADSQAERNTTAAVPETDEALQKAKNAVLYPNPAKNTVSIDLSHFNDGQVELKIINTYGQIFKQEVVKGGGRHEVNTEALKSGMYVVIIKGQGMVFTKNLLIE